MITNIPAFPEGCIRIRMRGTPTNPGYSLAQAGLVHYIVGVSEFITEFIIS
jgi:hypothetical protein